jgi:hypothetical protein
VREASVNVDARTAAADGYPLRNITTDLYQGESDMIILRWFRLTWLSSAFFDLGYDLFKTTPASHPIGDVFKPEMTTNLPAVR